VARSNRGRPERTTAAYRRAPRTTRAHWVLLLLGTLVLFGGLVFQGFIRHVGSEGSGPVTSAQSAVAPPEELAEAGPVLRIHPDGTLESRAMPAKTIALTFDDGPDPDWTPKILDVLARHGAQATFFVVGSKVNERPDLVRRMLAEGHEVGAHTFTHVDMTATESWRRTAEMTFTANAIAGATGLRATLYRPPYSAETNATTGSQYEAMRHAAAAGYLIVLTDLNTEDWRRPGSGAIVKAATPQPGQGAVVMLHDSGGDRTQTVEAVDRLITDLKGDGYSFTTVSAGLGLIPPAEVSRNDRWRGTALRWAQTVSSWFGTAMQTLLGVALVLLALRLAMQIATGRVHARRVRRRRRRLVYMGPVSVVVPAYNEAANIAATVRSLVANDYPHIEVIVVDDGSTDATARIVAGLRLPNVRLLRQANAGKPAALNHGLNHAQCDLIILVDGDTVFEPDAIGRLVQPFAEPGVGAVSGNTKIANRGRLLGKWQHLEYVMGFNLDRRMFDVAQCMPTVPGAIGAFRRRALDDVGGVSSATLAEDTDLTMAVIRAGWRVVYVQDAIAWTEAPATIRQLWQQRYRWCYGTLQSMWKHRRALAERGAAGRLGRRGLAYLLLFQIMLPLAAPAVDIYALFGLFFLPWSQVATVWFGLLAAQTATAAYALRLDRERLGPLWTMPLQQIVYRQLMYLVVIQSVVTALVGSRLRWHQNARSGHAATVFAGR
jgi:cellulose synthase/poly-beta-1,6-N-acetylglucosamine synthase-like glycosyltransferase/peptidoglycan/xylan/chitin deacetylase (PgdA/CDA1 family)